MSDKRPISIVRDGSLAASLWERKGKNGRYFEFNLSRSYKVGDGFNGTRTIGRRAFQRMMKGANVRHDEWKLCRVCARDRRGCDSIRPDSASSAAPWLYGSTRVPAAT